MSKSARALAEMGRARLRVDDPKQAFAAWRALGLKCANDPGTEAQFGFHDRLGLGKTWLSVGDGHHALAYANALLEERPKDPEAFALKIRALLRNAEFGEACVVARTANRRVGLAHPELRSAHAAALFRNRQLREAESGYRRVLADDPLHVEALIRLGTGLLSPRTLSPSPLLQQAVTELDDGKPADAQRLLTALRKRDPLNPIALRLLGELELTRRRERSPLVVGGQLNSLWAVLLDGTQMSPKLREFFPGFSQLSWQRRRMIQLSIQPFARRLLEVARAGGRHDILGEAERTTDAPCRAWLRGKKTFDGRGWDDVRGMGGLEAATGVESLDEAWQGGFQTLIHELAHQVHLYALDERHRERITELYEHARRTGCCLDYYAAANENEYFAQGVEAYFSYAKSAGQPVTHGHTYFELARVDPDLFALVREIVEWDPMRSEVRDEVLRLAFESAVRVGRVEDAERAAEAMGRRVPELTRKVHRAWNWFRAL